MWVLVRPIYSGHRHQVWADKLGLPRIQILQARSNFRGEELLSENLPHVVILNYCIARFLPILFKICEITSIASRIRPLLCNTVFVKTVFEIFYFILTLMFSLILESILSLFVEEKTYYSWTMRVKTRTDKVLTK